VATIRQQKNCTVYYLSRNTWW